MVDIATPAVASRARHSPKTPVADDETFRVAEELMLLSASRSRGAQVGDGAIRKDQRAQADETAQQLRRRQKALTAQFELLMSPTSSESSQTSHTRRRTRPTMLELEDIINSRVDVSHSQLLSEHRTQFRRARRRWTAERANRQKAMLARFKVEGIPLVQHLASLSH